MSKSAWQIPISAALSVRARSTTGRGRGAMMSMRMTPDSLS